MINPKLKELANVHLMQSLGISPDMLEGSIDDIVDILVDRLRDWDSAYADGFPKVDDSVYDTVRDILKQLAPKHPYFDILYSKDIEEIDENLDRYMSVKKMLSIKTVRNEQDLEEFGEMIRRLGDTQCNLSSKLNGHGVRVVFDNGDVVRATTRGRSKLGRDITTHMSKIIGHVEALEGYGLIEIRGEIVLRKDRLTKAREFNPEIKSAFTAVSSLIKPSATDAELKLLDFLGYYVLSDEVSFQSLSDMLYFIQGIGLNTPWFLGNGVDLSGITPDGEEEGLVISRNYIQDIHEILDYAEEQLQEYPYELDGIVLSVDSIPVFNTLGNAETYCLGNIALKMGKWKQSVYSSTILDIKLTAGKSKKTPVAVIEPIRADNGSTVRNVPLYNLATVVLLNAYIGHPIFFKYGGESGVIPCTPTGERIIFASDMSNLANTPDFDSYDEYDDELYDEVDIDDGVEYSDDLEIDNDEYEDDDYDEY